MGCGGSKQSIQRMSMHGSKPEATGAPLTQKEIEARIDASKDGLAMAIGDFKVRYAYVSQRGYYPDSPLKANQDQYTVLTRLGDLEDTSFFAVYDGHGKDGDGVSGYCRDKLHQNLYEALKKTGAETDEAICKVLSDVHVNTNADLHKDEKVDDSLSGTTAISVLMKGRKMFISNVGDSRAIIVSQENEKIVGKALSNDQTPYRKDERERCKKYGARILTMDQIEGLEPIHENWGDLTLGEEIDEGGDPPRIWAPTGSYPGTAFSRSIGDRVAEEFGVVAEPEIVVREVRGNDKYVIVASDGVWEFITNQMVAEIVHSHPEPLSACRAIVALAYELWLQYEIRTDDITIIALYLDENDHLPSNMDGTVSPLSPSQLQIKPVRRAMSRQQRQHMISETETEISKDRHIDMTTPIEKLMADRYVPKSETEKQSILASIRQNFLFVQLDDDRRDALARVMHRVNVNPGHVILHQGEVADCFYVVETGRFEVRVAPPGTASSSDLGSLVHVHESSEGHYPSFGELSLLYGKPRSASVVAATEGTLWSLDRHIFARVVLRANYYKEQLLKILKTVTLLKCLNLVQLQQLVDIMVEEHFIFGDYIYSQGDTGEQFYVIQHGRAKCTLNMVHDDGTQVETPVMFIADNDFFGERALLTSEPRQSNVVAETDMIAYSVTRKAFESVFGPLNKLLSLDLTRKSIATEKLKNAPQSFDQINLTATIDSDEYGSITIGAFKAQAANVTVMSYLLSEVEAKWLKTGITSTLEATRIISENPGSNMFIPELINSFRQENALHLAYSTTVVSDLVSLIRVCGAMVPDATVYIGACVVSALESLHGNGIIYRAVQPECLYLDVNGRVVIMNYEACKIGGVTGKCYTICGASDYLAPEQISQEGHNASVDFWQLGVLLYEVGSGVHPFSSENEATTFSNITTYANTIRPTLSYPDSLPTAMKGLIQKLLNGNPNKRLGTGSNGFEKLKTHNAFSKIPWNNEKYFVQNSPLKNFTQMEYDEAMGKGVSADVSKRWTDTSSISTEHIWIDMLMEDCSVNGGAGANGTSTNSIKTNSNYSGRVSPATTGGRLTPKASREYHF